MVHFSQAIPLLLALSLSDAFSPSWRRPLNFFSNTIAYSTPQGAPEEDSNQEYYNDGSYNEQQYVDDDSPSNPNYNPTDIRRREGPWYRSEAPPDERDHNPRDVLGNMGPSYRSVRRGYTSKDVIYRPDVPQRSYTYGKPGQTSKDVIRQGDSYYHQDQPVTSSNDVIGNEYEQEDSYNDPTDYFEEQPSTSRNDVIREDDFYRKYGGQVPPPRPNEPDYYAESQFSPRPRQGTSKDVIRDDEFYGNYGGRFDISIEQTADHEPATHHPLQPDSAQWGLRNKSSKDVVRGDETPFIRVSGEDAAPQNKFPKDVLGAQDEPVYRSSPPDSPEPVQSKDPKDVLPDNDGPVYRDAPYTGQPNVPTSKNVIYRSDETIYTEKPRQATSKEVISDEDDIYYREAPQQPSSSRKFPKDVLPGDGSVEMLRDDAATGPKPAFGSSKEVLTEDETYYREAPQQPSSSSKFPKDVLPGDGSVERFREDAATGPKPAFGASKEVISHEDDTYYRESPQQPITSSKFPKDVLPGDGSVEMLRDDASTGVKPAFGASKEVISDEDDTYYRESPQQPSSSSKFPKDVLPGDGSMGMYRDRTTFDEKPAPGGSKEVLSEDETYYRDDPQQPSSISKFPKDVLPGDGSVEILRDDAATGMGVKPAFGASKEVFTEDETYYREAPQQPSSSRKFPKDVLPGDGSVEMLRDDAMLTEKPVPGGSKEVVSDEETYYRDAPQPHSSSTKFPKDVLPGDGSMGMYRGDTMVGGKPIQGTSKEVKTDDDSPFYRDAPEKPSSSTKFPKDVFADRGPAVYVDTPYTGQPNVPTSKDVIQQGSAVFEKPVEGTSKDVVSSDDPLFTKPVQGASKDVVSEEAPVFTKPTLGTSKDVVDKEAPVFQKPTRTTSKDVIRGDEPVFLKPTRVTSKDVIDRDEVTYYPEGRPTTSKDVIKMEEPVFPKPTRATSKDVIDRDEVTYYPQGLPATSKDVIRTDETAYYPHDNPVEDSKNVKGVNAFGGPTVKSAVGRPLSREKKPGRGAQGGMHPIPSDDPVSRRRPVAGDHQLEPVPVGVESKEQPTASEETDASQIIVSDASENSGNSTKAKVDFVVRFKGHMMSSGRKSLFDTPTSVNAETLKGRPASPGPPIDATVVSKSPSDGRTSPAGSVPGGAFAGASSGSSSGSPFGSASSPSASNNNPFGGPPGASGASSSNGSGGNTGSSPFGSGYSSSTPKSNPFGAPPGASGAASSNGSGGNTGSSPFGSGSSSSTPKSNPFGAPPGASGAASSNGGGGNTGSSPFGSGSSSSTPKSNPFGAPPGASGASSGTTGSSPFGSSSSSSTSSNTNPFGSPPGASGTSSTSGSGTTGSSPFGFGSSSSTPKSNPFGASPGASGASSGTAGSSPFGSGSSSSKSSSSGSNPFGSPPGASGAGSSSGSGTVGSSPFGSGSSSSSTSRGSNPFGSPPGASGAGSSAGKGTAGSSPFIAGPSSSTTPKTNPFGSSPGASGASSSTKPGSSSFGSSSSSSTTPKTNPFGSPPGASGGSSTKPGSSPFGSNSASSSTSVSSPFGSSPGASGTSSASGSGSSPPWGSNSKSTGTTTKTSAPASTDPGSFFGRTSSKKGTEKTASKPASTNAGNFFGGSSSNSAGKAQGNRSTRGNSAFGGGFKNTGSASSNPMKSAFDKFTDSVKEMGNKLPSMSSPKSSSPTTPPRANQSSGTNAGKSFFDNVKDNFKGIGDKLPSMPKMPSSGSSGSSATSARDGTSRSPIPVGPSKGKNTNNLNARATGATNARKPPPLATPPGSSTTANAPPRSVPGSSATNSRGQSNISQFNKDASRRQDSRVPPRSSNMQRQDSSMTTRAPPGQSQTDRASTKKSFVDKVSGSVNKMKGAPKLSQSQRLPDFAERIKKGVTASAKPKSDDAYRREGLTLEERIAASIADARNVGVPKKAYQSTLEKLRESRSKAQRRLSQSSYEQLRAAEKVEDIRALMEAEIRAIEEQLELELDENQARIDKEVLRILDLLTFEMELEVEREANLVQLVDALELMISDKESDIAADRNVLEDMEYVRSQLDEGMIAEKLDQLIEVKATAIVIEDDLAADLSVCLLDLKELLEDARDRADRTKRAMEGLSQPPETRALEPFDWSDIEEVEIVLERAAENVAGEKERIRELSQRIDDALVNRAVVLGEDVPPGLAKTAQRSAARSIQKALSLPDIDFGLELENLFNSKEIGGIPKRKKAPALVDIELELEDLEDLKERDEKELLSRLARSFGSATVDSSKAAFFGLKALATTMVNGSSSDRGGRNQRTGQRGSSFLANAGESMSGRKAGIELEKAGLELKDTAETVAALGAKLVGKAFDKNGRSSNSSRRNKRSGDYN